MWSASQASATTDLGDLTRRIAAVTSRRKRQRSYLDTAVTLRAASAIWPHLKPESRAQLARRQLPLTAGISNVHCEALGSSNKAPGGFSVSAAQFPMDRQLPLILLPTTLGQQMNVAVSYRMTGFSQAKIADIMQLFVEQIESLDAERWGHKPKRRAASLAHAAA